MIIPEGVDHVQFYWQSKKTNIKITSRFPNVYIQAPAKAGIHGNPKWVATYSNKSKNRFKKSFPFSELGERSAHLAVERHIIENNITERRGRTPRKYKIKNNEKSL